MDDGDVLTRWVDVQGAAEYLACTPRRIYNLVGEGRLRAARDWISPGLVDTGFLGGLGRCL